MAQPSQALPSWLTLSSTLITEPDGSVSTSFTTLTLPLTYYGPSIPLGTDGVWTYGGLTSPPPTSSAESTTAVPSTTSPPTITPSATSTISSSSLPEISSTSVTSSPAASSTAPAATGSHGISNSVLGAILGSILGVVMLVLLCFIICLLRRHQRRRRQAPVPPSGSEPTSPVEQQSSSFWNRQTSLSSREGESTPIWTGWDLINPEEATIVNDAEGPRTPGEGSPRGSGEEVDPFLTRRSIRSGTIAEEMTQTKTGTDTLVSVPAAAVVGSGSIRSSPRTGHIIPRDQLIRMAEDDRSVPMNIRVVEPSPPQEHSPLLPPPPLDPDGLGGLGVRTTNRSDRRHSDRSLVSQNTNPRSLGSQKSMGSLDSDPQEGAELLTARRVRVGEPEQGRTISSALDDPEAGPSSSGHRNTLGLGGLSGRLGRFSWFKRMSSGMGTGAGSSGSPPTTAYPYLDTDPYTRTPPRGSRSRPSSWARLTPHGEEGRTDFGVGLESSRPISSVSGKSGASGNTVYHDATSRPVSTVVDIAAPPPVASTGSGNGAGDTSSQQVQQAPRVREGSRHDSIGVAYSTVPSHDPPAYDDNSLPRLRTHERLPSDIDILDIPAPSPASPFASSRPEFPPGLVPLPEPRTWRDSYTSYQPSPTTSSSNGIAIDVLEDEPPAAREGWRTLATGGDGRRTTFGTPLVIHPPVSPNSEQGSLHSMRSHLSPYSSQSPAGSAPASRHTLEGSGSSRPSAQSHNRTESTNRSGSLAHSSSISSHERRRPRRTEVGEVVSPPLSAVFGGFGSQPGTRPTSPLAQQTSRSLLPALGGSDLSPSSSRTPLLGAYDGTVNSNTNSSVTTAVTDPITGAVMHFPSLPFRSVREEDSRNNRWTDRHDDEAW